MTEDTEHARLTPKRAESGILTYQGMDFKLEHITRNLALIFFRGPVPPERHEEFFRLMAIIQLARDQLHIPDPPEYGAPAREWSDWYCVVKRGGYNITHEFVADMAGYSAGYLRQLHIACPECGGD